MYQDILASLDIQAGIFEGNSTSGTLLVKNNAAVSVSGGTFVNNHATGPAVKLDSQKATLSITGGTYSTDVAEYCADGYCAKAVTENGVTSYAVVKADESTAAAKVTAVDGTARYYATIQKAVDAAENGEKVTLLQNIELSSALSISVPGDITLDLNGHTLSYSKNYAAVSYNGTGVLTIQDSSTGQTGGVTSTQRIQPRICGARIWTRCCRRYRRHFYQYIFHLTYDGSQ